MLAKWPRKAKTRVRYTQPCDESSDLEDSSDYASSGDEWGLDEVEGTLEYTSSGDESEWNSAQVDSHRKARGKFSKPTSIPAEVMHQFPKSVQNSTGPSLRTCDNTSTCPTIRRLLSSSQTALPSTQPQDAPSIAVLMVTSPSVQTPNMTSPFTQSLNVTSPQPRSSNMTSPHPRSFTVTSPHPHSLTVTPQHPKSPTVRSTYLQAPTVGSPYSQSLNVTSPHPQSLTVTSPHSQSLTVTSPHPQSLTVTSPHPHSPIVISRHPQSLAVTSSYPQSLNVTSPHPQFLNVTSPHPHVTSPCHRSIDVTLQSTQRSSVPFSPHVDMSSHLISSPQKLSRSSPTPNAFVSKKQKRDCASNIKSKTIPSQHSSDVDTLTAEYRDTVGSDATLNRPAWHSFANRFVVEFRQRYRELLQEMSSSGQPKQCPLCCGVFSKECNLLKHVEKYHEDMTWGIRCTDCQETYSTARGLERHNSRKHGKCSKFDTEYESHYQCTVCSKPFGAAYQLEKHIESHNEKNLRCDECGRYFSGPRCLKRHKNKFHKPEYETQFKCSYCCRTFRRQYIFLDHLKLHSDEQACLCDVCGKTFHDKHRLLTHKRNHSEEKDFVCIVCSKGFKQPGALATHMRVHTGERPYKCSVCNKSFKTQTHLENHIRVHTGDRPYKCSLCDKSFITIGNRINHMKTHGS